ncbi:hypothetical protein BVC80_8143g4 [Macleaya cordata]|uniref:Uncharacterized protein n=1 Tax=Macleaya cordata TaxID=56857 RepID=A0A200R076_MACCD|nr:hypothetical protein BVC80_8143g4 [Macleaya cordata]
MVSGIGDNSILFFLLVSHHGLLPANKEHILNLNSFRHEDISPSLYKISRLKDGRITDFIDQSPQGNNWNLHFSRDPRTSEIPELLLLLQQIGPQTPILDSLEDTFKWSLTKTSLFTVKSTYDHLLNEDPYSRQLEKERTPTSKCLLSLPQRRGNSRTPASSLFIY